MIDLSTASLWVRARSRMVSSSWARSLIGSKFRSPAPPLKVWNARKMVLNVSASSGLVSNTSTPCSMFCRCSCDSEQNSTSSSPSLSMSRTSSASACGAVGAGATAKDFIGRSFKPSSTAPFIQLDQSVSCLIDASSKTPVVSKTRSTEAIALSTPALSSGGSLAAASFSSRSMQLTGRRPKSLPGWARATSREIFPTVSEIRFSVAISRLNMVQAAGAAAGSTLRYRKFREGLEPLARGGRSGQWRATQPGP